MFSVLHGAWLWSGLLVAAPIIIHILNRRRYREVPWAAMELLLAAEMKNRKRVQLEHLLLLLLRCLAVLLIVLFIARPLATSKLISAAIGTSPIEHVIVLDDSPSMAVKTGQGVLFDNAIEAVKSFTKQVSSERPGDTLSVVLTSDPKNPWLRSHTLSEARLDALHRSLDGLTPTDIGAQYSQALLSVESLMDNGNDAMNWGVYVVSDFRALDWAAGDTAQQPNPLTEQLSNLSHNTQIMRILALPSDVRANVGIVDIKPSDKNVVKGIPTNIDVRVKNFGPVDVSSVNVGLTVGDGVEQHRDIPVIAPGESEVVTFSATINTTGAVGLMARSGDDKLAKDNARPYAVEVGEGVQVLVVNGEPRNEAYFNETFYLNLALSPPGEFESGYRVSMVSEAEFEQARLDEVQTIFLCNHYQMSEARLASLTEWVGDGGGLVIFPGDMLDYEQWNETFGESGSPIFPAKIKRLAGDETRRKWETLSISATQHPVLKGFAGEGNPFLQKVKTFRWWYLEENPKDASSTVLMRFSNNAPAAIERHVGRGKVLQFALPADAEWGNWPSDLSYVILMQELGRYMARPTRAQYNLSAGQPLAFPADPGQYSSEALLKLPGQTAEETLRAVPMGQQYGFQYPALQAQGLYQLTLSTLDGTPSEQWLAVAANPDEGDLVRATLATVQESLKDTAIIISQTGLLGDDAEGDHGELWRTVLMLLLAVLIAEQCVAWWFSHRRRV